MPSATNNNMEQEKNSISADHPSSTTPTVTHNGNNEPQAPDLSSVSTQDFVLSPMSPPSAVPSSSQVMPQPEGLPEASSSPQTRLLNSTSSQSNLQITVESPSADFDSHRYHQTNHSHSPNNSLAAAASSSHHSSTDAPIEMASFTYPPTVPPSPVAQSKRNSGGVNNNRNTPTSALSTTTAASHATSRRGAASATSAAVPLSPGASHRTHSAASHAQDAQSATQHHSTFSPTSSTTGTPLRSSQLAKLASPSSVISSLPPHSPSASNNLLRSPSSSFDQSPICGTIWMQNKTLSTIKKYKKRFIVLQRKKLQIFKTDLEFKPRFTIPLNNAVIIPTKPKKFQIQSAKKTFKFKCVSEEQRAEWLEYLCREQTEKNAEQMRELILKRILVWNEEQQRMLFSIQNQHKLLQQEQYDSGSHLSPVSSLTHEDHHSGSAFNQHNASAETLRFSPISITGLREIHKSMELLRFLTHEELYCVLTKTLRDLTLVSRKQVTVKKIQFVLAPHRRLALLGTPSSNPVLSYVDNLGEMLLVIREGFLYPKQETIERLLTWKFAPSAQMSELASKLGDIFNAEAGEHGTTSPHHTGPGSDLFNVGSPSNSSSSTKRKTPQVDIKFALTENDTSVNAESIIENITRLTEHFRQMKERDSYVFKLSAELLGSIIISNSSVSFFSKRGDAIIENFSTQHKHLPSLLVNNQRIMDLVLRHKVGRLEDLLVELSMKSKSVCGKKVIFSLGGDIRARAAARVSSPRPIQSNEGQTDDLSSDDRIQLAFVQLIQRLIDEVPDRYRLKTMKNIDEVVISMQSTKIQENLLVDGVIENKGRFQLSADELKQTLKKMNKHNKAAMSMVSHKTPSSRDAPDTNSDSTTTHPHRDSLSESSEHLSENASIDLNTDDDEHVHAYLRKNFSKQFSLSEREVDQIVDEALKQLRKMWHQPQHEFQLHRFIHDYIELVDLDESLVSKLYQITLDRKKSLNQKEFEFRTVAVCLLSETLPQIVQDNLSRRRDIVLFGLKNSGKTQLLYKLKLNKNVKTSPSVGILQEVVAFQDLNLMFFDIGGQTKEKDALKFFTKHRHDKLDALIFMIDAATFMSNKEQVSTLLLRYVKKIMKVNSHPPLVENNRGGTPVSSNERQQTLTNSGSAAGAPSSTSSTAQNQSSEQEAPGTPVAHHSCAPPLLIFLNKQDLPNSVDEKTVEQQMEPALNKLTNKWAIHWKIQSCSVLRGDGLYEGLQFLSESLSRKAGED